MIVCCICLLPLTMSPTSEGNLFGHIPRSTLWWFVSVGGGHMRVRLSAFGLVGALLVLTAAPVSADRLAGSSHGGRPLAAELSGQSEVPPNGSPATGSAKFTVNHGHGEVCWAISFSGLTSPATAAHIHVGPSGANGPVVIPTPVPVATSGVAEGCAVVDRSLAKAIKDDPAAYYHNIHTATFPGGEIRGQLHR